MTWMTTASGLTFNLARPAAGDILIEDIAHHLAHINRFNGATCRPYSVAEHSILTMRIAAAVLGLRDPFGLLAALLHDAHEAYMGDLIQPLKVTLAMSGTFACQVEHGIERAVGERFSLRCPRAGYRTQLRQADLIALATERRDLMPPSTERWPILDGIEPWAEVQLRTEQLERRQPAFWRAEFLAHFRRLRREIEANRAAIPVTHSAQ